MSRSERRMKLTQDNKRPLPEKGTYRRRVVLFEEWQQENLAPGKPRTITTFKKWLHVTKGFRLETETKTA